MRLILGLILSSLLTIVVFMTAWDNSLLSGPFEPVAYLIVSAPPLVLIAVAVQMALDP